MDLEKTVSVFVPENLRASPGGWLLGWWSERPTPVLYVLAVVDSQERVDRCLVRKSDDGFLPSVVGRCCGADDRKKSTKKTFHQVFIVLGMSDRNLVVEDFSIGRERVSLERCQVFVYEPASLRASELLECNGRPNGRESSFAAEEFGELDCVEKLLTILRQWEKFRVPQTAGIANALGASGHVRVAHSHARCEEESAKDETRCSAVVHLVQKVLFCSSFVHQLNRRLCQAGCMLQRERSSERQRKCLRCCNTMISIVLDVLLGIFFLYHLFQWFTIEQMLDLFMTSANCIVDRLQTLIYWLMGFPAGFKLNHPLNSALGQFFLYHIYLWKTYMAVVKPLLHSMLEAITWMGWLGLSFQLSLFSDLLSLATFHVYCFYVYAARLYHLHVTGLISLGRLVRGRKWNPLRQRVDMCMYSTDQLYLGTIIFMILLFLMPTTLLYYVVFTTLRLASLTILGMLNRTISIISTTPVYAVLMYIRNSALIRGEIRFVVQRNRRPRQPLLLDIQTVSSPLSKIWRITKPWNFGPQDETTWSVLFKNLAMGKLIYPF